MEDISVFSASPGFLMKMAMFAVIQVLVYLILSNSSAIFSANDGSHSLRSSRSASIRRLLAGVSDLPSRGELTCNTFPSSSACAAAVSGQQTSRLSIHKGIMITNQMIKISSGLLVENTFSLLHFILM
ncbi:uncharacterized protein LOC114579814 isoform X2 [Dendrobium catenatum]|uniref:uncharacterized protein LOC114579814 isoform X2 n=1 Tax=Dendrobium catenatum TaxID=906689 RepID=UPI00109F7A13|nr:uncharacterized protein LOC114579814 isoform X2 [Dendrobium catenatum]